MNKKTIYLDQNKWIQLARCYSGRDKGSEEVLRIILEKSNSGEWIFPLSSIHYFETRSRMQEEQRLKLADFMGTISKNWGIYPFGMFKKDELISNLKKDNKYSPIKHNPSTMFGKLYDFEECIKQFNIPEEDVIKVNRQLSRINFFKYIINYLEDNNCVNELEKDNEFYAECFSELRTEDMRAAIPDKHKLPILFMQCFNKEYEEILNNFTEKERSSLAYEMFKKEIPKSFYVNMNLIYLSKLKNKQRINDKNDYKDIVSISQALPYCDVVITERYWASLIQEHKLDSKYGTLVSKDINILKTL